MTSQPLPGRSGSGSRGSRMPRTSAGYKVTVEHRRGVNDAGIAAALEEVLSQVRSRGEAA